MAQQMQDPVRASVLSAVTDLDTAISFFCDRLGAVEKFRDADRYCALDIGRINVGLLSGTERIVDQTALAVQMSLEEIRGLLEASGVHPVRPLEMGPHEYRAVVRAPGGSLLVLSAPLQSGEQK
jgi:hypothetical protein